MSLEGNGHAPTAAGIDPKGELTTDTHKHGMEAADERREDHVASLFNQMIRDSTRWSRWKLGVPHTDGTEFHPIRRPRSYAGSSGTCASGYIPHKDSKFSNVRELVTAIQCCLTAHKKACRANYEVSTGNIPLYSNTNTVTSIWGGSPNGRELWRKLVDGKSTRQFNRTRTWEFASVHALVNYSMDNTISDDLESFFHVLLYFAIRFLLHNAAGVVEELLFSYFDDCTDGVRGDTCGATKYTAMHDGRIDLTRFTGSNVSQNGKRTDHFLTFLWPDNDTTSELTEEVNQWHPIGLIISDLLQWFKALYAQDIQVVARRLGPPKSKAKRVLGHLSLALPGIESSDLRAPLSPIAASQPTESERLAQQGLSRKLETHDPMVQLLAQYITQLEWPDVDKSHDKKPKIGYTPPQDNIPATSTKIGLKRGLENGEAEPSSKRVRREAS